MAYKVRFPSYFAEGLEKTWRSDEVLHGDSRSSYFDVQASIIQQFEPLKDVLAAFLTKGDRVLEAGCGSGRWVDYLNKRGYRCTGMDIDQPIAKMVRGLEPGMELSVGNVFSLPFKAGAFDAVLSSYVLEHFTQGPLLALKEAGRVLKPGGLLFFIVPFNSLLRVLLFNRLLDLACGYRPVKGDRLVFHEYRYNREECRDFLVRAGFEPVKFFPDECSGDWNKGVTTDYRNMRFYWPRLPDLAYKYRLPRWASRLTAFMAKLSPWSCCGGIACVARKVKPVEE
jgi:SAM-dependent methyltransferase